VTQNTSSNLSLREQKAKASYDALSGAFEDIDSAVDKVVMALEKGLLSVPKKDSRFRVEGPVLHLNPNGSEPPIIWVFNDWAESVILQKRIDENQPVVCLKSMARVIPEMRDRALLVAPLVERYVTYLVSQPLPAAYIVGGSCQAAHIAEGIAHALLSMTNTRPLLMSVEHEPKYCYPGSVVLIFGDESPLFNPFLGGSDPAVRWRRMFGRASWFELHAAHGEVFLGRGAEQMSRLMQYVASELTAQGQVAVGSLDKELQI